MRAQQVTGDPWAEDPGCYLDDDEIGATGGRERVKLTPFAAAAARRRPRHEGACRTRARRSPPLRPRPRRPAADAGDAVCRALRGLPRRPAHRRHGAGAAAREPGAAAQARRGRDDHERPHRDADAGFADKLSAAEIRALAEWIYTPPASPPAWGAGEIRASRIEHADAASLPARPKFGADPMNLFVVVEGGDHHVSLVDGDRFEPIDRFASRYALHGGPKFTPDGRFVYFGSRDGWITKYDLWNLAIVAEVRAGLNMRNVAVSRRRAVGDGGELPAAHAGAVRRRPEPGEGRAGRGPRRQGGRRASRRCTTPRRARASSSR